MNSETEQIFLVNCFQNQSSNNVQKLGQTPGTSQVNLENVEDFSNVCRTCATATEFVVPIFEGEGLQNNLADKIHKHLPIQVTEQDSLPRVVCVQCASTLLAWHELVLCCVQADQAFNTWLTQKKQKPLLETETKQNESIENVTKDQEKSENLIHFENKLKSFISSHFPNFDDQMDADFVCQSCTDPYTMTTLQELSTHLLNKHTLAIKNESALEKFITNNITQEEVLILEEPDRNIDSEDDDDEDKNKNNVKSYLCPFCECIFTSTTRLICHLNQHVQLSIEDGVMCCDVFYKDKNTFAEHLQKEHVSRVINDPFVCRTCGAVACNADELKTHVIENHKQGEKERNPSKPKPNVQKYIPAVCPDCNKTFSNKYNMLVHLKTHSGSTSTYFCDLCDKSYSSRGNLMYHKRLVHQGVLEHPCDICGEAFPTRAAREIHARIHTGEKPFSCDYCGKSYRAKNTLDRHVEIHLDIRKYECNVCSKKFRKSTHLNYHLNTHKRK